MIIKINNFWINRDYIENIYIIHTEKQESSNLFHKMF